MVRDARPDRAARARPAAPRRPPRAACASRVSSWRSAPRSASRSRATATPGPPICCAAPTSRCTRPRSRAPARCSTTRRGTASPGTGCGWPRTSAAGSPRTSWSSGTSRRSMPPLSAGLGVEALVRWQHPTEGLLLPLHFLPDARRSGLMLALSEAVAHQVVADARRWLDSGFCFRVSMNCAPPELLGGSLLPRLFDAIESARLPAGRLLVEVTEDSFLSDPERAREMLLDIRAHDVQVSIDDYGTGFSSLAYLRDLPVQELKMDRSFVGTIRHRRAQPRDRRLDQADGARHGASDGGRGGRGLRDRGRADGDGRRRAPGHHIAPPMAASEFGPWMRRWSARTRSAADAGQGVGQLG